jgi:GTPase SAR1 family protein
MPCLTLADQTILLESDDSAVQQYWRWLFGDWLHASVPPQGRPAARLLIERVDQLPPLPQSDPFFVDRRDHESYGLYSVMAAWRLENGQVLLHFFDGGTVYLPDPTDRTPIPAVRGIVTDSAFATGRLEDLLLISLAPFLREQGYYLLHAAAVSRNGQALLLVGPSGSGKTTTCLNLVQHGWQLLANDVVMVGRREGRVYAFPLPDKITIRPKTLTLLPLLARYTVGEQPIPGITLPPDILPTHKFVQTWSDPAPVAAICFPHITPQRESNLALEPGTVTLARLLEESLDCWDSASLEDHTSLLADLTRQAQGYRLALGSRIEALPSLLHALALC